jgi:hypothetical protein
VIAIKLFDLCDMCISYLFWAFILCNPFDIHW